MNIKTNDSNVVTLGSNPPAVLKLTRTMLEKHIIDANASVRAFAKLLGIDYDTMKPGEKRAVDAEFVEGDATQLMFYRTRNRGDKRFSISGIKAVADVGDTVAITYRVTQTGDIVLVINCTNYTEFTPLLQEHGYG
jgi:ubiquinone/menaquinone biosynthesis C-methylase UbiE